MSHLSYKTLFIILFLLLIPIVFLLRINQKRDQVSAAWWDEMWNYRQAISISNSSSSDLTDFQVSIDIGTSALIAAGKMQSDCDDIRITDQGGNLLPFWIEENNPGCNAITDTKIWVKAPSLPTSGATIYFYYGNSQANNTENGNNVFEFFDDFNSSSLNTDLWTATGSYSQSGGSLTITTGAVRTPSTILSEARDHIFEYRTKWSTTGTNYAGLMISDDTSIRSGNSSSRKLIMYMSGASSLSIRTWAADGTVASYNLVNDISQYIATADTYYINSFSLDSSNVSFFNNYTQTNSYSGTWSAPPYLWLGYFTGSNAGTTDIRDITVDWIKVRKYASSEPTATPQSEEVGGGPIAYWKFDEGVGTTTYDSIDSSPASLQAGASAPSWANENQCISGKCLDFKGSFNYVYPGSQPKQDNLENYTLSAWINMRNRKYIPTIINKGPEIAAQHIWWGINSNNRIWLELGDSGSYTTYNSDALTWSLNKWYYVAVSVNNETKEIKHYRDGKLINTLSFSGRDFNSGSYALSIGRYYGNSPTNYDWDGFLDEVKIFPYARTADQIKADYTSGLAGMGTSSDTSVSFGGSSNKFLSDGLVGYWKMDEGVGTTTVDSSGNNNTATFGTGSSAPSWSNGKYGIGLSFDGVGTYATSPNTQSQSSQKTICTWVKTPTSSGYKGLIIQEGGYYLRLYNMKLEARVYASNGATSDSYSSNSVVPTDTWTHVCEVIDASTSGPINLKFYINGLKDFETNTNVNGPNTGIGGSNYTTFGNDNDATGRFLSGSLDEVRVYNRALSPTEVKQLYEFAPGPVTYWDFDNTTDSTVNDISGNGYNGSLWGSYSFLAGKIGKSVDLDGSTSYVSASNIPKYMRDYTYSFWMKMEGDGAAGYNSLLYRINGGGLNRLMVSNSTKKILFQFTGSSDHGTSFNYTFTYNNWYYISFVKSISDSQYKLYVNGVYSESKGIVESDGGTNTLYFGYGGTERFNGKLDEFKIYNYARTQKQILEDMNAGSRAGPLIHYKFDEGYGSTVNNFGIGGTGYTGILRNNPSWTLEGKSNKGITLDGLNDYVEIPINTSLKYTGEEMTISLWYKPDSTDSDTGKIISRPWNGSGEYNYWFNSPGGSNPTISFLVKGETSYGLSFQPITTGTWHHLVATLDSNKNVKLYTNGKLTNSGTHAITQWVPTSGDSNLPVAIGTLYPYGGAWAGNTTYSVKGSVDEVKIYNYALSEEEIKSDYNQSSSAVFGVTNLTVGNTSTSALYCIPGSTDPCSPPVGEWKFDEKIGSIANDTSGNGNTLALTNVSWTTGKIGSAGLYNPINSTASIADNPSISLTNTGTLQAWVNSNRSFPSNTTGDNYRNIINKWTGGSCSGNDEGYAFDWYGSNSTGNLRGMICNGTSSQSIVRSFLPSPNTWYHVSYVWSGSSMILYVNGSQIGNTTPQTINNQDDVAILRIGDGFGGGTSYRWDGKLDQVRIYNYARTPAQIAWDYNQGAPVGHWKLDECQGTTIHDSSGNNNHGTLSVGASGTQSSPGTCTTSSTAWGNGSTGKINSSLNFDGSDDYVNIPNNDYLNPGTSDFSISMWIFKNNKATSYAGIFTKNYQQAFGIYDATSQDNDPIGLYIKSGSNGNKINFSEYYGKWTHLTWTVSNSANKQRSYVNGVFNNETSFTVGDVTSTYPVNIGRYSYNQSNYFNGKLDDIRLYNFALTSDQIKQIYNGGAINFN